MPIDPDNIRVDVLKVKRKLFVSYPFGSKEQKDFLIASKLAELGYLTKLVPQSDVAIVFEEYEHAMRSEVLDVVMCFLLELLFTGSFFTFHLMFPKNDWVYLLLSFSLIVLGEGIRHITHMIDHRKKVKPFKDEFATLQRRIQKIKDELQELQ